MGLLLASTTQASQSYPVLPIVLSSLGICIAIGAFAVAFLNFRLSRFPSARVNVNTYSRQSKQHDVFDHFFDVEVESRGLPIYDMKVYLEADYRGPFCKQLGLYKIPLISVGTLPNPMNAGQVAKFRTMKADVQKLDHTTTFNRGWGLSDLPPERVAVCVYGSGERLVKRYTAKNFAYDFTTFDTLKKQGAKS